MFIIDRDELSSTDLNRFQFTQVAFGFLLLLVDSCVSLVRFVFFQ
jgi:hypothetical protein